MASRAATLLRRHEDPQAATYMELFDVVFVLTLTMLSITHVLMVGGFMTIAMSYKIVIGRPIGETYPTLAAVILGGPALFLIGRALFEYVVFHHVSPTYAIGVLVLAAVTPGMVLVPPLAATVASSLVLAGVATIDTALGRRHRSDAPPAPA